MYDILKEMKIDIIKPLPGLTKLVVDNKYLNKLNGIRTLCKASIIVNDEVIKEEEGELQLTNYGLSGIVIFNLSRYASINLEKNNNVKVKINFLHTIQNIEEIFVKNNNIKSALNRILDEKLVNVLLKDLKNLNYNELTKEEKNELFKILTEYEFIVTGIKDFNNCQVSVGGVSLNEVDLKSLESLKISNLYFTGEILDVDGDCGGYNLTFAWLSALIVSRSIRRKNDKSK
jgi:predicted Rossmann fold flavoprotein